MHNYRVISDGPAIKGQLSIFERVFFLYYVAAFNRAYGFGRYGET